MTTLQENIAQHLVDFLSQDFFNSYYTRDAKNFIDHASRQFKEGKFEVSWSLGGTSCGYDGSEHVVSAEPEENLNKLDDFLMAAYPNTTFMQYKIIERQVKREINNESDYYGGRTQVASKTLHFHDLQTALLQAKLESESPRADLDAMIEAKAHALFPQTTKTKAHDSDIPDLIDDTPKAGIEDEKRIRKPRAARKKPGI